MKIKWFAGILLGLMLALGILPGMNEAEEFGVPETYVVIERLR